MAQCGGNPSRYAATKPTERDLVVVAERAGSNWSRLLISLDIPWAIIPSIKTESSNLWEACMKGLVIWLKGGVSDSNEPVTFGTLFAALKDSGMADCVSLLVDRLDERSTPHPRPTHVDKDEDLSTPPSKRGKQLTVMNELLQEVRVSKEQQSRMVKELALLRREQDKARKGNLEHGSLVGREKEKGTQLQEKHTQLQEKHTQLQTEKDTQIAKLLEENQRLKLSSPASSSSPTKPFKPVQNKEKDTVILLQEKNTQLQEKDTQLQEKDTQLPERDTLLQEKDTLIAKLLEKIQRLEQNKEKDTVTQLQEKDTQLQEKDTQLQEKDTQLQEKHTQLQEKHTQLQEKDTQLQEKNTQLQEKDTQLQEKDTQLPEKDTLLQEKDTLIAKLLEKTQRLEQNKPPRNWRESKCQKTLKCGGYCYSIAVQGDVVCVGVEGRVLLFSKTSGAQVSELGSNQIEGIVYGVAFIDKDTIVVSADKRLRTYTTKGQLVRTFDSGLDEFSPRGLTVGPDGSIFVCDFANNCVCVFNVDGKLLSSFGSKGSGHFKYPSDVFMDGGGLLFISDSGNRRICVHSVEGAFIRVFPTPRMSYCVAATHCNHLVISSYSTHTVMIMTTSGQLLHEFGEEGSGPGQFNMPPAGVAVDNEDCVYVCDTGNKRVQVY